MDELVLGARGRQPLEAVEEPNGAIGLQNFRREQTRRRALRNAELANIAAGGECYLQAMNDVNCLANRRSDQLVQKLVPPGSPDKIGKDETPIEFFDLDRIPLVYGAHRRAMLEIEQGAMIAPQQGRRSERHGDAMQRLAENPLQNCSHDRTPYTAMRTYRDPRLRSMRRHSAHRA